MKRRMTILFLFLLALTVPGLLPAAADELPEPVQARLTEYLYGAAITDSIRFDMADGSQCGLVLSGNSVIGYEYAEGECRITLTTFLMDGMYPAHLVRSDSEETAFSIVSENGRLRMTYRLTPAEYGMTYRLCEWRFAGYDRVIVDGETLRYGFGAGVMEEVLPGGVVDWPWQMDDLPLTPQRARELAAITEERVAALYPDYTLRSYVAYNHGTGANAAYSCVMDGMLYILRASFTAGEQPCNVVCQPVPLSASLLERLESEPFDALISCSGEDCTFLTQSAFDRERLALPESAILLDNQVQETSVIALVDLDGVRHLYIWELTQDGSGFTACRTLPLPEDVSLDLFHSMDDEVLLVWGDYDCMASFSRNADGQWLLRSANRYGEVDSWFMGACAFGIWQQSGEEDSVLRIGTLLNRDLFTADLTRFDASRPQLDQSGWAAVANPDPADRLHLRTEPSRSSRSQGKLYNGTPLRVLAMDGEWTKVQLGFGSTARTGWVMTKFLAFGEAMDSVKAAFPELIFREEYEVSNPLDTGFLIVGVEGDAQYILLGQDGDVAYVPQSWLWQGNG